MQPLLAAAGNGSETTILSPKLCYTRAEAAEITSLGLRTIDYMIEQGAIPVRRVGRKILITHQALQQFLRRDHKIERKGDRERKVQ